MRILGISGSLICDDNHDCAAALFENGRIVANYEEERLTRVKHSVTSKMPDLAIKKILTERNLTIHDIDAIGIPHDPNRKALYKEKLKEYFKTDAKCFDNLFYTKHHHAHIYDSFFTSGFESAACLIVDGYGDQTDAITLAQMKDNELKIIKVYPIQSSIGMLYNAVSQLFGFGSFGDGKVMGLSSYGKPIGKMPLVWEDNDIKNKINLLSFDSLAMLGFSFIKYITKHNYPYGKVSDTDNIMYYSDIASTLQSTFNEIIINLCKQLKEETNEDNLILSGGCIQNCIANNLIVESGLFKNIYAGPAPHDGGAAAGLAFLAAKELNQKIENIRLKVSYTGKEYTDKDILAVIDTNIFNIEKYEQSKVIDNIENGYVIAWFQGGSEIGPRALGHRSILANPALRKNLFIINDKIKHRENWRPLAPSIPNELFNEIFESRSIDLTEFMLRTIEIKQAWRKKLIAVCHIDNTTRPQTVDKEQNEEFYNLLKGFYDKTGIPGLINTSFNDRDEPIIETPEQAMNYLKKNEYINSIVFNAKYWVTRK